MSVLAKNIKTIRKELWCTQSVLADILKVGFRTYVRYEAGERDAPVNVLVKMAKLGNISLEQLLTSEINKNNFSPIQALPKVGRVPQVRQANFRKGQISFKNPPKQELLSLDASEKKLLSLFRKMDPSLQTICVKDLVETLKGHPGAARAILRSRRGRRKNPANLRGSPASRKSTRKKGRPGRKKVDKELLKEKIEKLKMTTGSINKITVR